MENKIKKANDLKSEFSLLRMAILEVEWWNAKTEEERQEYFEEHDPDYDYSTPSSMMGELLERREQLEKRVEFLTEELAR